MKNGQNKQEIHRRKNIKIQNTNEKILDFISYQGGVN